MSTTVETAALPNVAGEEEKIDINEQINAITPETLKGLVNNIKPIIDAQNSNTLKLDSKAENNVDANNTSAHPSSSSPPPSLSSSSSPSSLTNSGPVNTDLYDIDGDKSMDGEKNKYKGLGEVNAARLENNLDPLLELRSGGRRRTKHKKHHKKGGKKSHKKGKSSKKVAKRRKSCKTGGRRSRKQNKH